MKLTLIAFGKLKTPGLREAADNYLHSLKTWKKLIEIELKPKVVPDKSTASRLKIQKEETEVLEDHLKKVLSPRGLLVCLDEKGKNWNTTEWADFFKQSENESISEIVFVIGSSLGLSEEVRQRSNRLVSLGRQTFPHELARVALLEQIYRSFSVLNHHPYHHAD